MKRWPTPSPNQLLAFVIAPAAVATVALAFASTGVLSSSAEEQQAEREGIYLTATEAYFGETAPDAEWLELGYKICNGGSASPPLLLDTLYDGDWRNVPSDAQLRDDMEYLFSATNKYLCPPEENKS